MAEQNFADAVLTSTFYDKKWSTNNILRTYQLEYPDGTLEDRLDYSDWQLTSIIKRIRRHRPYRYKGIEKFTTIMQREYDNTTIYRIILMYNGFMHPYEIPSGAIIKLPYAADLEELIRQLNTQRSASNGRSVLI